MKTENCEKEREILSQALSIIESFEEKMWIEYVNMLSNDTSIGVDIGIKRRRILLFAQSASIAREKMLDIYNAYL